jgi:hypothetical protein
MAKGKKNTGSKTPGTGTQTPLANGTQTPAVNDTAESVKETPAVVGIDFGNTYASITVIGKVSLWSLLGGSIDEIEQGADGIIECRRASRRRSRTRTASARSRVQSRSMAIRLYVLSTFYV